MYTLLLLFTPVHTSFHQYITSKIIQQIKWHATCEQVFKTTRGVSGFQEHDRSICNRQQVESQLLKKKRKIFFSYAHVHVKRMQQRKNSFTWLSYTLQLILVGNIFIYPFSQHILRAYSELKSTVNSELGGRPRHPAC